MVLVAVIAVVLLRDDPYVAPPVESTAPQARPGAAAQALGALERALAEGDEAAAAAVAPADDADATATLTALARNAAALDVVDLDLRYVDEVGGVDAEGRWSATVDLTWRFDGVDEVPAAVETQVRFGPDGEDGATVVDVGAATGEGERTPVWWSGPVAVARSADALVLVAHGDQQPGRADDLAERLLAQAETALAQVGEVLPERRPLVVEAPATPEGLDAALGVADGTYDAIAAVTAPVDGSRVRDAATHVFLNPTVYGGLGEVGAQVVMTHEFVHVATAAPSSVTPTWLLEGFADYVALRDVDLPVTTTAGQVIAQVRADGAPRALPAPAEFEATRDHLGAVYEASWLVCVVLVERAGQEALVRLYEEVDAGGDLTEALQVGFDWTEAELTAAWRTRLEELAG